MEKVRCKFRCDEITKYSGESRKLVFVPQYDNTIPEDVQFAKATPSGKLEIVVQNPNIEDFFVPGKYYYFDAVKCE